MTSIPMSTNPKQIMIEEARNEAYTKAEVGETDFSESAFIFLDLSFFTISCSFFRCHVLAAILSISTFGWKLSITSQNSNLW